MKIKKTLAVILTVVMLVLPLAVFSAAEGEMWEITSYAWQSDYSNGDPFCADGLEVYDGMNWYSYNSYPERFSFEPAVVTCAVSEVEVYFDGVLVGTDSVNVGHISDSEVVSFGKNHGCYCAECGKVAYFEEHTVADDGWIPNDDATFLVNETETGICTVCGEKVTRTIDGTAGYLKTFNPEKNPYIIMIIEMIASFISTIKGLAG